MRGDFFAVDDEPRHETMVNRPNPFDGLEEWLDRLNRQLETAARSWESELDSRSQLDLSMGESATQLDLADHGDTYVVTVDVPGFDGDDLESRLRGDTLEISGEREREQTFGEGAAAGESETDDEEDADDATESPGTYIRRERETQSFSRQVRLPDPVDADAVTASLNNGILTIWLPKLEPSSETHAIDIE